MFAAITPERILMATKLVAGLSVALIVIFLVLAIIMIMPCGSMLMGVQSLLIILVLAALTSKFAGGPLTVFNFH